MEVLELNGITYVKASSIARDLGYTADYVGQLCRSGKVDAQLVGRSWYVSDESIRTHKGSRYRSTKAKTKQNLIEQKHHVAISTSKESESKKVPLSVSAHNFYHTVRPQETKYIEDASDLIPILREKESSMSTEIAVKHADAHSVFIGKKTQSYSLEASERPKIRFKGKLSVTATEEPLEKEGVLEKENEPSRDKPKIEETRTPIQTLEKKDTKLSVSGTKGDLEGKIPLHRKGAITMRKMQHTGESGNAGELIIKKVPVETIRSGRATFTYISTSLVLVVLLTVGFLIIEQTIIVTLGSDTLQKSRYSVNLSTAIESIFP
ncbi:hypothetical protein N8083_00055 [Candidatus Pacebacteria bacterium]|nr:hypothetical protein [Candidatus Paceibacterota bacterium]